MWDEALGQAGTSFSGLVLMVQASKVICCGDELGTHALDIVQPTRKNPSRPYLERGLADAWSGGPKKSPGLLARVSLPTTSLL